MASRFRTRAYKPNQLIHWQVRGYERRPIFLDDRDQREFASLLRRKINATPAIERPKLLAAAQMRNHQHGFTQNGRQGDATSKILTSVKISYAAYFNDRYRRSGPVFERPFKARQVLGGADIINVMTYIHLNPDETLRDANSTHPVYTGDLDDAFIDQAIPLRAFGGREAYLEFFSDTKRIRAARRAAKIRLG
jgi:REP element-mobilizing transposase RayT